LEYLLLAEGFSELGGAVKATLLTEAESVYLKTAAAVADDRPVHVMCPLNRDGRCLLYLQRPMICRLHGIPHELHRPGGGRVAGPGCADFDRCCGGKSPRRLDRTPYYIKVAHLERALQQALGVSFRIKMTVAEMLMTLEAKPTEK
jgi:hypothetical protein